MAQVQPWLLRTDFPLDRDALVVLVRERGADERVAATIERLPAVRFADPGEVLDAVRSLDDDAGRSPIEAPPDG